MHQIVVIGPVDDKYLLGYYAEGAHTFFVIHSFFSKGLADLTAWRMNQNRQQGVA